MASEDESSDSSDDFLVPSDQLNLNSSFFQASTSQKRCKSPSESSDTSDDDFICDESENKDSAALLAEVMRNLSKTNDLTSSIKPTESPSTSSRSAGDEGAPSKMGKHLSNEINDLLLKGESGLGSTFATSVDESEEEPLENPSQYSIPSEGVKITLPGTEMIFNRHKKRKGIDLEAELIKKMNRRLRTSQLFIHKVGLLCWLAHGFHLNCQTNNPEVLAIAMSLVPEKSYPKGRIDLNYLESFTKWFKGLIKMEFNQDNIPITKEMLVERLGNKKVHNYRELVLLYVCMLRAMGLNCRLVISLCPPALKPRHDQLFQSAKQRERQKDNQKDEKEKEKKPLAGSKKGKKDQKTTTKGKKNDAGKILPENSCVADIKSKEDAKKRAIEMLRTKYVKEDKKKVPRVDLKSENEKLEESKDDKDRESPPPVKRLRFRTIKQNLEMSKAAKTEKKRGKEVKVEENIRNLRGRQVKQAETQASTSKKGLENDEDSFDDDATEESEDSGFERATKKKKVERTKKKTTKSRKKSIDRRVLSTDDENTSEDEKKSRKKTKKSVEVEEIEKIEPRDGHYLWPEVYVESEESWICVNVPDDKIHCVSEIYKKTPTPVLYVIAWNSVGTIKDVTRRYCPHWLTVTRKKRVEEKWWDETLSPWKEKKTAFSRAEDEMLLQKELEQPLPKTMSECKGHPLYVLARHLLKFEALYPPECVPLGHLKNGDAIYSRHCVHTLRSRETWLKQARVVKPAQESYKTVKSMPKYDKLSGTIVKGLPLELFGKWQTMPYVPPEAKNGIVPRNEYGNVDLFQQCMLPKGTVHIDLPGLFRVAKKLDIDCVPAIVGFNFGGRGAMPMTQGYVVCEEFEDTLREAWEEEQVKAAQRAQEKRDKRIWGNWRKLIRGVMIKERITAKYLSTEDDNNDEEGQTTEESAKSSKRTKQPSKKPVKKKKT